jgi:hypothetical protein
MPTFARPQIPNATVDEDWSKRTRHRFSRVAAQPQESQTMPQSRSWNVRSLAFLGALFLLYIPFEDRESNTMWPRYIAIGVALLFLGPILLARPIKLHRPAVYILVGMLIILVHTIVFRQVSFIYPFFVGANILVAVLIYEASRNHPKEFHIAVTWLLVLSIVALLAQVLLYYMVGGPVVDIHELVFGSPSRAAIDFVGINRFSGLQVEPGTYANNTAFLLAIYLFTAAFSRQMYIVAIFTLLSILLTGSATSVYFTCVMLMLLPLLWRNRIKAWHVIALLIVIAAFFSFSNILDHLDQRFNQNDDGSLSIWKTGLHSYLATGLDDKIIGLGYEHPPCLNCYYQDLGVTFNLVSGGGLLMVFVLVLLFYRVARFNGVLLAIAIFMMPMNSRMYYYEPPVWMLFLFAQANLRKRLSVLSPPPADMCAGTGAAVRHGFSTTQRQ